VIETTLRETRRPSDSLVTTAHVVYGLHALSVLIGASSIATIVGAFVFGIPSIIAVIINYAMQSEARGTFLESHFRWQIRTFWFAALWSLVSILLFGRAVGGLPHCARLGCACQSRTAHHRTNLNENRSELAPI
jgi:uncharacterized membrane protein